MSRPISVLVHIDAMRHNVALVRKAAGSRTLWAVVKANAYGHGLENAVSGFAEADGLAMLEASEARRARAAGWQKRLLMLEGFFDAADALELEALGAEPVIHSRWQIELLKSMPHSAFRVHVKINSGMNRLGFQPAESAQVISELRSIPGVEVLDAVTHFANAELPFENASAASVSKQLRQMQPIAEREELCMANSAAGLMQPAVAGNGLRAGIALYGISPSSDVSSHELGLKPTMTLSADIIALRSVARGGAVGYGSRWTAQKDSRIAVVACGYADGYPRSMPDGAPVWVEGQIAPIAGAVSMDMLTIDVTHIPQAQIGSRVELWGEHICVNDLARRCGTIGYELLCAVASRVPVSSN